MLDRVFGALPAKPELTPVADRHRRRASAAASLSISTCRSRWSTSAAPGIARKDPDFMAAYIVNHILGGGSFSSRLYQRGAREARACLFGLSTAWCGSITPRCSSAAPRRAPTAPARPLDLIEKEIHRLAENGPTEDELAKAKAYLNSSFVLNLDTSSKIAALLVQLQLDDLGIDYYRRGARR